MSSRQKWSRWLSTSDAALSWTERIARWIAWGVGGGVFSTILSTVIGFVVGNPLSGLVIGVVVGMVVLVAFAVHAVKVAAAGNSTARNVTRLRVSFWSSGAIRPTA